MMLSMGDGEDLTIDYVLQTEAVANKVGEGEPHNWILDSGATSHMTPHAHYFHDIKRPEATRMVMTGAQELLPVSGIGTVIARTNTGRTVKMQNVLLVPKLAVSLMSLTKLLQGGLCCEAKGNAMRIYNRSTTFFTLTIQENLLQTPIQTVQPTARVMSYSYNVEEKVGDATLSWHKRLGHMSQSYMKLLISHKMAEGVPLTKVHDFTCDDCHRGKMKQSPYPKHAVKAPVTEKLALVHIDICGPFRPSRHGYKYFATITDDATRYRWVLLLKTKDEVVPKFKEWLPYAETQSERKLKALRSDHGTEFTSYSFENFLKERGIAHDFAIAFHPQQNGVAERLNQTLEERVRTMLITAQLPVSYWEYAIKYATWLINRSVSSSLLEEKLTPYEAWTGRKANLGGVHTFGCMAVCLIPKSKRDHKLAPTGEWLLFLGMSEDHKAWLLVNPTTWKEAEVRSAAFHEEKWLSTWRKENNQPVEQSQVPFEREAEPQPPPRRFSELLQTQLTNSENATEETLGDDFVSLVVQPDGMSFYMGNLKALFTGDLPPEPRTVDEALSGPYADKWKEAMDQEMHTLLERGTWELTELPPGKKPVGVKWVFKVKTNADGIMEKFKARLVAKGFTQIEGEDFYQIFAPVSDYTTARMLLAVAAVRKHAIIQLDVKNAFLYGDIDAQIYMKQPEGYHDGTSRVCKLVKALYGLKQSPRMWYHKLSSILEKHKFKRSIHDEALFVSHKVPSSPVWCLVYVDDILMTSPSAEVLQATVDKLKEDLTLTSSETLTQYLGMNLWKTAAGEICLSAEKYAEKLQTKFSIQAEKRRVETPLPSTEPVGMEPVPAMDEFNYLSKTGSLLYAATCCRPDMQHGVSVVAQTCKQRHQLHCYKLERVLQYLLQTKDHHLCYGSNGSDLVLRAYCDASFGPISKTDTNQRSSYGWVFTLGGSPISWCARRFDSTSLHVCDAELMAIKETTAQAIHLQALLAELGEKQDSPTTIHTDSKAAHDSLKSENFSKRLKHVTVARQWVREQLANNIVEIWHVRTHEQPADFFTKPLPAAAFKTCCKLLGLKTPREELKTEDRTAEQN